MVFTSTSMVHLMHSAEHFLASEAKNNCPGGYVTEREGSFWQKRLTCMLRKSSNITSPTMKGREMPGLLPGTVWKNIAEQAVCCPRGVCNRWGVQAPCQEACCAWSAGKCTNWALHTVAQWLAHSFSRVGTSAQLKRVSNLAETLDVSSCQLFSAGSYCLPFRCVMVMKLRGLVRAPPAKYHEKKLMMSRHLTWASGRASQAYQPKSYASR